MKLYLSYKELPELAPYTPRQRRIVWLNFIEERSNTPANARSSQRVGGVVILAFLIGIVGGAICWKSPETGGLVGGLTSIALACFGIHLYVVQSARSPLREYIASDKFSLIPISKTTRIFLDPFRRHDD